LTQICKNGIIHIYEILNKLYDISIITEGEQNMIISDRIFEILQKKNISQKQFSEKTGIPQSTISEWKSKKTNPSSEKIMLICEVLDVTPEWLLSGAENEGKRGNKSDWYVIDKDTDIGLIIDRYNNMDPKQRDRLIGYIDAMTEMDNKVK